MKVYVLETGVYENRGVSGIFDSAERAMAAAGGKWTKRTSFEDNGTVNVDWENDQDWDSAASVSEYELTDTGPLHQPDATRVEIYRPLNGMWAYLPESPASLELGKEATRYLRKHSKRNLWREPEPTDVDRRIDALLAVSEGL